MINPGFHTDKIEHGYLPTYLEIAADIQRNRTQWDARVLEIGVRDGTSLDMWLALFPHAHVTGVDNSPASRWPAPTGIVVVDQTDPTLADQCPGPWHLIVDDASHFGEASAATFATLWPTVVPGGYYVIEDWYVGGPAWPSYDRSMLTLAETLLSTMLYRDTEPHAVDSITYRYGMIIIRKSTR